MPDKKNISDKLSLETIIPLAVSLPGVRVDRDEFLRSVFKGQGVDIDGILGRGPVEAGCSREQLQRLARELILRRTSESSIASFLAGMPGGLALGVAVPADVVQYFGFALRLAQELSYLYGAEDLWRSGTLDSVQVNNRLLLYCGVMLGASGAANGVRLLSASLARTAAKKLPQLALTKTLWYPLVKQIGSSVGVKVTKSVAANGVAKIIPVVGGVISGGITFASMGPMGRRLAKTLDEACFDYSPEEIREDVRVMQELAAKAVGGASDKKPFLAGSIEGIRTGAREIGDRVSDLVNRGEAMLKRLPRGSGRVGTPSVDDDDPIATIERLAHLRNIGAISSAEYESKKAELLRRI